MTVADQLNHAFRQGYAAAIVAKEGGELRSWKSWCSTHDSEQVRPGENICFRSPVVFPTVEAEAHRCRIDRRVLLAMPEPDGETP